MKKILWGAVLGTMALVGCRTDGTVAKRDSSALEQAPTVRGTVERDYKDLLVLEDKWGDKQYLRLSSQTRYFQDGKQVSRESLVPGSSVRASFDPSSKELLAREIHILGPQGVAAPPSPPPHAGHPIP